MISHLYKITHSPTGKYYYGKHNGMSQNGYWGSGKALRDFIKKYGTKELSYEILCYGSPDYIFELESKLVTKEMIEDSLCLNLCEGGLGSPMKSEEQKRAQSERMKGRLVGEKNPSKREDVRAKLRGRKTWNSGKKYYYVDGVRVEGVKPKKITPARNYTGQHNSFYGKTHSEESRKKISESNLGKRHSKETREKISNHMMREGNPRFGVKLTQEHIDLLVNARANAPLYECIHCKKQMHKQYITRYHNEKCKMRGTSDALSW
jgi:hypothetical protein